jgi:acetyl-CoA acetyltransferase
MDDAGMKPSDIDGITAYALGEPEPSGLSAEAAIDPRMMAHMMGITPVRWFSTTPTNFGDLTMAAIAAVSSGFCHTCLVLHPCRTAKRRPTSDVGSASAAAPKPTVMPGDYQFASPFGSPGPGAVAGMTMQRHMAVYGTTAEQFGLQQVSNRYNASLNPEAMFRDPITLDDYFNSRWISRPVRLLDCDYPCDMSGAVIITTEERAHNWKNKPVFVESAASASTNTTWDYLPDLTATSVVPCAEHIWAQTDLKPSDVDCAMLYDGFAVFQFAWMEGLGFCKPGESGPFVEEGHTQLHGSLPVNTDGGVCNVGRRHGASHCIEAVRQLRGEAGERQVPNAEVSIYTVAHGPHCHAALLTSS